MLDQILAAAPQFLMICVRCFALIMTLPLFSARSIPRKAKIALTGYLAFLIFPNVDFSPYAGLIGDDGAFSLQYVLLLAGEGMIGVIMGFYVSIIFAAFSTAGQFFAFQMGFSASEVYDALSQVENPLMGQYLNLIAMLVFFQSRWINILFGKILVSSFSVNALMLVESRRAIVDFLLHGLTKLFADAFMIALPIMGTLMLISVVMGMLSKAAPMMNLLSEGFPIMILTSFFIITMLMPTLIDFFLSSLVSGFNGVQMFINKMTSAAAGASSLAVDTGGVL